MSFTSNVFSLSSIVAIKEKLKTGGKKGTMATKGVEHDAMGIKWNKSMWDNMESKNLFSTVDYRFNELFGQHQKVRYIGIFRYIYS